MDENHDDFAFEPVRGLPENLPSGETMLWQGAPEWRMLARNAFHVVKVAVYFAALAAWRFASALFEGAGISAAMTHALWVVPLAAGALGILCLLAWLYGRSTVYTITTKRIVIRSGLALPVTLNLPFGYIESAAIGRLGGSKGNIALTIAKPNRLAFLVLWPHAKPFQFAHPVPMLRALDNVDQVAGTLASALEGTAAAAQTIRRTGRASSRPHDSLPAGASPAI